MNTFQHDIDFSIIQNLKPLIPHVDTMVELSLQASALAQLSAQATSILALIAQQPVFVPEYKAFLIPAP